MMILVKTYRDIQLIDKDEMHYLAIACDVSASIGPKEQDLVKVTNKIAGYYATAVPLIELLSIGASPLSVVNTLGVEMNPSGKEVILGIEEAMRQASIPIECLTGSTEDNIPTVATSVGVTIISELMKNKIKLYKPLAGQRVFLVGIPKYGQRFLEEEVLGHQGQVIDIELVKRIRSHKSIGHILPVGSKGVKYELETLLAMNELEFDMNTEVTIDLEGSAGPATCMLVCCHKKEEMYLKFKSACPVTELGKLK